MRFFAMVLLLTPLSAQQTAPEAKPTAAAATQESPPAAKPQPAAPTVATDDKEEAAFTGSIEIGNRWNTGIAGNSNAYRSVVNLGEGPKLLGADFILLDPKKRLFDRIEARGSHWGDDPYSSLHVNASKARRYDLNVDYRNIAYFNYLPSFANPLLDRGILLNQNSYDIRRRLGNIQLDLFPGGWLVPYLAYERSSGLGNGITTFVANGNEYAVPTRLRDGAANYRGGVRLALRRTQVTIEQGGTTFRDDQEVFTNSSVPNPGNRGTPLLGQNLFLTGLREGYGVRGSGVYTSGLLSANPASWLDVNGQFRYSVPGTDTRFQQVNTGNFSAGQSLFVTAQQFLLSAQAKLPHSSGSFGAEVRPVRRIRILTSWLTDRLHVSSAAQPQQTVTAPSNTLLVSNYNQSQVDVLFDVSARLVLRGGHRYVWGEARQNLFPEIGLANSDSARLGRHVAIAGFTLRPTSRIHFSGEVEAANSEHTYFRTSLRDYRKARARARYQAMASLSLSADFSFLNNRNPLAGINYDSFFRQSSVSLFWAPKGGKPFTLQADYTRSTLRSDLSYLAPPFYQNERSFYRDNSHLASALIDVAPTGSRAPKFSVGGSLAITSGSRPTQYFQPLGRVSVPAGKHVAWVSQWRYYGFGETIYRFQAFRTHLITTGFLLTR